MVCCEQQAIVSEAGFLWRRVLRRYDARINALMAQGFCLKGQHCHGVIRVAHIAVLARQVCECCRCCPCRCKA